MRLLVADLTASFSYLDSGLLVSPLYQALSARLSACFMHINVGEYIKKKSSVAKGKDFSFHY